MVDQPVTVDHGDLLEICQAAEAWARSLRRRAEGANLLTPIKQIHDLNETADRIDQAIQRSRQSSLE